MVLYSRHEHVELLAKKIIWPRVCVNFCIGSEERAPLVKNTSLHNLESCYCLYFYPMGILLKSLEFEKCPRER